jgi:acetylxylan esterase
MKAFVCAALATLASAASLVPVRNFGPNPSNITMNIYVPDKLPPNPAIVLVVRPPPPHPTDL